ncbi:unnamed protein product [Gongylonema pulchrum]|uniref:Ovule protein n=1 Tax=Gongylonema pulchrum TaxID=637853 RepID=A0A183EPN4_9BILA|nr:unnamed protein product [Gongylonema pulchrum]
MEEERKSKRIPWIRSFFMSNATAAVNVTMDMRREPQKSLAVLYCGIATRIFPSNGIEIKSICGEYNLHKLSKMS